MNLITDKRPFYNDIGWVYPTSYTVGSFNIIAFTWISKVCFIVDDYIIKDSKLYKCIYSHISTLDFKLDLLYWEYLNEVPDNLTYIQASEKGSANGVATLGIDGKISTNQIPQSLLGATKFKGFWDPSSNVITSTDPTLTSLSSGSANSTNLGWYYICTTTGSILIDGVNDWKLGDWIISIGSVWGKIDNTDAVTSVNGKIGLVVLTTADINDSTNRRYVLDSDLTKIANSEQITNKAVNWNTLNDTLYPSIKLVNDRFNLIQTGYTAPSGNIKPLLYYDGTRFRTYTVPSECGYDDVANVVYFKQLLVANGGTFNSSVFIHKNSIGNVSTTGFSIENTTPATNLAKVQRAPAMFLGGNAWSNSGAKSVPVKAKLELIPDGSGYPVAKLYVSLTGIDGVTYKDAMIIGSDGDVQIPNIPVYSNSIVRKADIDALQGLMLQHMDGYSSQGYIEFSLPISAVIQNIYILTNGSSGISYYSAATYGIKFLDVERPLGTTDPFSVDESRNFQCPIDTGAYYGYTSKYFFIRFNDPNCNFSANITYLSY